MNWKLQRQREFAVTPILTRSEDSLDPFCDKFSGGDLGHAYLQLDFRK